MQYSHDHRSVLVNNMRSEASEMETFPVLFGNEVAYFHHIDGGYNSSRNFDVVNLVHEVQGYGSPYRVGSDQLSHEIEAHLSDSYYYLDINGIQINDEYPDEDYVVSLKVQNYKQGPESFSEELTADIDRRETRYES